MCDATGGGVEERYKLTMYTMVGDETQVSRCREDPREHRQRLVGEFGDYGRPSQSSLRIPN